MAMNKADISGRFAMAISRYYMQGINSIFFFIACVASSSPGVGSPLREEESGDTSIKRYKTMIN